MTETDHQSDLLWANSEFLWPKWSEDNKECKFQKFYFLEWPYVEIIKILSPGDLVMWTRFVIHYGRETILFKMLDAVFPNDLTKKIGIEKIKEEQARVTFNAGFHDFGC